MLLMNRFSYFSSFFVRKFNLNHEREFSRLKGPGLG